MFKILFKKMLKKLKLTDDCEDFITIECQSTISCRFCGRVFTYGKLLGNQLTLEHKPASNCPCNYKIYKLISE